jgi:hypothetical protein
MTERLAPHVTVFTTALVLFLSPLAWAQQENRGAGGAQRENPNAAAVQNANAGQNRNQSTTAGTETIRGVVSGITAEGETMLDFRTNTAARSEGAYLTIVGSPKGTGAENVERRTAGTETERNASSGKRRHNIYIAWLSPRTKICEIGEDSTRSNQNQANPSQPQANAGSQGEKPCTFDQLEVGDHVEIQFSRQEESGANNNVHLNQQMRQSHGRNRTFVGYAMSIKVLPAKDHEKSSSGHEATSTERSR